MLLLLCLCLNFSIHFICRLQILLRHHINHPDRSPLVLQLMQHGATTTRRVEGGLTSSKLALLEVPSCYSMRVRISGRRWEY